jgi:hypothetical protein
VVLHIHKYHQPQLFLGVHQARAAEGGVLLVQGADCLKDTEKSSERRELRRGSWGFSAAASNNSVASMIFAIICYTSKFWWEMWEMWD